MSAQQKECDGKFGVGVLSGPGTQIVVKIVLLFVCPSLSVRTSFIECYQHLEGGLWLPGTDPPRPEAKRHHVEREEGYLRLECKVFSLLVTVTD